MSCNNGEEKQPDSEKKLDHLIFQEISYSGTWHEQWGSVYKEDQYLKITNPTEEILYLDGLGLIQSALSSSQILNLKEGTDYRSTHFGASLLIRFPGQTGGQDYPLKPGESVTLAEVAVDHTQKPANEDFWLWNKDSYNLSNVDFEWASKNQIENDEDYPENPNVPNMVTVYPNEPDDVALPKSLIPQYGVLGLIKIPTEVSNEDLLGKPEYRWSTTWASNEKDTEGVGNANSHVHDGGYEPVVFLKIPNEWVIDAVQICPQNDFQWNVVADEVEKGSCSLYSSAFDKRANPKAYVEKSLYRKHDGKKYVDTNNSDVDFEVRQASMKQAH